MEYKNTFNNESGVEVEIRIKAECPSEEAKFKALSFMAQCSHRFYLETGRRLNNMLSEAGVDHYTGQ